MANGKSGRKKLGKVAISIIVLLVVTIGGMFGINIEDIIPTGTTSSEATQQPTQPAEDVEGQLVVHMIDQTTPNMIQRLNDIVERKPLISIGI